MTVPKQFFYRSGQEVVGPLTGIELRQHAVDGHVTPQTPIRIGEQGEWAPAARLSTLFDESGRPIPHEESAPAAQTSPSTIYPPQQPRVAAPPTPPAFAPVSTAAFPKSPSRKSRERISELSDAGVPLPPSLLHQLGRIPSEPPGGWLEPIALAMAAPLAARGNRFAIWRFAIRAYAAATATYPLSFVAAITSYGEWKNAFETSAGRSLILTVVLSQVAALLLLALGHYVAQKMIEPNEQILERPYEVTTLKPYYCFGVVLMVVAVLFVLMGIWQGLLAEDYRLLLIQWLLGIACYSAATYLFDPSRLFIHITESATTSDNAIALVAFLIKVPIVILPATIAVAACIATFLNVGGSVVQLGMYLEWMEPSSTTVALALSPYGVPYVLGGLGMLPLLSFFFASLTTVLIDVIRSIHEIAKNSRSTP